MVVKVDRRGHIVSYGNAGVQNPEIALALARQFQANRALTAAVTGRLSSSGGVQQIKNFLAVPAFADSAISGVLGGTKATLDASLALVNDALDALFFDANAAATVLGIPTVVYAGGGTKASPIAAITGAGVGAATSATAANMNPIRDQINTNLHTAAALYNKIARATGFEPVLVETTGERQPPPDDYGAGGTGLGGSVSTSGSGVAFGAESPFTDPTPAITEDSGTFGTTGVTKASLDAALDTWRNNVETLATRLALVTNTIVALTDSSTGTAGAGISSIVVFPADTADVTTSLAGKASTDAEMVDIRDSIASLFTKANALASGLGGTVRAYDGLGTPTDTLAAVGAVTPAITGAQFTDMEAWRAEANKAFDALAEHVNELCALADVAQVARPVVTASFPFDNPVNPQQEKSGFNATTQAQSKFLTSRLTPVPGAAIPVDSGTAADPGQQAVDVDARFTTAKDNLATLAAKLNAVRSAAFGPQVKIV